MAQSILIVDNDAGYAGALAIYLERRQFEVIQAADGQSALEACRRFTPAMVLTDIDIADTDVAAMTAQIKRELPLIEIIVATTDHLLDRAYRQMGDIAFAFLCKPIRSAALDHALRQACDRISLKQRLDRYSDQLENLHRAQVMYRQLFDEVPCYISVQDRSYRLTATNYLFQKDFGDEIGCYCYQIYKHRESPCPTCPVASTFEDGLPHETEEVVTSKSGEQYHVLTRTAPIRDENGDISQVMEMSTNITQIRRLQDHLTSLGLMLGSMSHGVKGMLTALDGGIYQLESGLARNNQQRVARAAVNLEKMVGRVRKLVLDILYYAKSRELEIQQLAVEPFCRNISSTFQPQAEKGGVRLITRIESDLGNFRIDPNWLQSALINFLENALDACTDDAKQVAHFIRFIVRREPYDRICFEIEDNGMGMDRETREKMFTLFFSSKGSRGTGLGMFIAHHVIRQHGGRIDVTAEPGQGSRFVICMPRNPSAERGGSDTSFGI